MQVKSKAISTISAGIIWLSILMAFPFSISQAYHLPFKLIIAFCFVMLAGLTLLFIEKIKVNGVMSIIFLTQLCTIVGLLFLHRDTDYINLFLQLSTVFLIYISLSNYLNFDDFIKKFSKFILLMGIGGVIAFILCLAVNLKPVFEFINPDGRTAYNFLISFTNVYYDISTAKIIRPSGFFDEPGTLAFYLIVAILLNDLTFSNKRTRIILFISGVFTLSIAFYALAVIYMLLRFKYKYLPAFLLSLTIFSGAVLIAYSNMSEEKQYVIYNYTFGRIENLFADSNAKATYFKGDNRSDLIQTSKEAIQDSPIIGQGIAYRTKPGPFFGRFMGANPLSLFGIHGLLGGLLLSIHVIYYFWCSIKFKTFGVEMKSSIIYFLLVLQRPDFIGGILPYLAVTMLIYVTTKRRQKLNSVHD